MKTKVWLISTMIMFAGIFAFWLNILEKILCEGQGWKSIAVFSFMVALSLILFFVRTLDMLTEWPSTKKQHEEP